MIQAAYLSLFPTHVIGGLTIRLPLTLTEVFQRLLQSADRSLQSAGHRLELPDRCVDFARGDGIEIAAAVAADRDSLAPQAVDELSQVRAVDAEYLLQLRTCLLYTSDAADE